MKRIESLISESDLQLIWSLQLFDNEKLMTEDSLRVYVEFPGVPSVEGGPDFRFARVFIGGELHVGSVELHLYHNGWTQHKHQSDLQYSNVILQVCLYRTKTACRGTIPVLILERSLKGTLVDLVSQLSRSYPCEKKQFAHVGRILDAAGDSRIRSKVGHFKIMLNALDQNELLYRELMAALGYKHNKAQFHELAVLVPYSSLKCRTGQEIEKTLLEASGLGKYEGTALTRVMTRDLWRRHCVRPSNYPSQRIRAASNFIASLGSKSITDFISEKLDNAAAPDLTRSLTNLLRQDSDELIGQARAVEIVFNVILPFFIAAYEKSQCFEKANALYSLYKDSKALPDNFVTRYVKSTIFGPSAGRIALSARQYFGLLQLYKAMTTTPSRTLGRAGIEDTSR